MKKIVYTCISGEYDTLRNVSKPDPDWEYICFTDHSIINSNWDIREIPKELQHLDNTRKARALKILPHLFFEYDECIWLDGNIEILGSIEQVVSTVIGRHYSFAIPKHPSRTCIYQEEKAVIAWKTKENPDTLQKQTQKYRAEGYPEKWGLVQSQLIYRKHKKEIKDFCLLWWNEVLYESKRDQMSFNYVFWKNPLDEIKILNPKLLMESSFFLYWNHQNKGRPKYANTYGDMPNLINGKPTHEGKYSIVCASNNDDILHKHLLSSPDIQKHELIIMKNYTCVCKAYNEAKHTCPIVIFVHQDVFLPETFFDQLDVTVHVLENKNWGILSPAGIDFQKNRAGYICDRGNKWGKPEDLPRIMKTADELMLIIKKSTLDKISFDEKIPSHHLFGTDICLQAENIGLVNFGIHAYCHHTSSLPIAASTKGLLPESFKESTKYIKNKWDSKLPIPTSSGWLIKEG